MKRASSTLIRTGIECQRKMVFQYGPEEHRKPIVPSRPMCIGTIGHAILEFRGIEGRDPTDDELRAMEGNYEDPVVAIDAYPDALEQARASCDLDELQNPIDAACAAFGIEWDDLEAIEFEKPLEDFGVEFSNGVDAGGYIDLYLVADSEHYLFDWKFRGRLDYAPRTDADFRSNVQLTYYPAIVARGLDLDRVHVGHGNILRAEKGGPRFVAAVATIDRWFLDGTFAYYDAKVEEFDRVLDSPPWKAEVDTTQEACYKYGPCPHLAYCKSGGRDLGGSFFERMKAIYGEEE